MAYTDAEGLEQVESLPDVENLIGSAHNDILAGDRRDNAIDGRASNNTLYGGPGGGDDVMNGGPGNDRLAGGPDADTFVFSPGDSTDTVADFSAGTDKIDLTAFEIESIDDLAMTTSDDGVTIDLTDVGGGSILLEGLTALPEAGDFLV